MSSLLRVILDDNTGDIRYGGGQWTLSTLEQWYQKTSNYPTFTGNGIFGSLNLTFQGTSVAFIGNTPGSGFSQFATVSIDGGSAYSIIYGSSSSYIQWYQSPTLSDGIHTIIVDHLDGTAVDMAIITASPATPLTNREIFVDNNDPSLQYIGKWNENDSQFQAGSLPDGFPIGNTTQRSTTVGDMMIFKFTGTAISIYGIFLWTNIGSISVTYTLDGVVQIQSYPVTASSAEHITADGEATNFLFFEKDSIPAGNHVLTTNITDIQNQTFIFDYLVYSPSFSSLATMPNLKNLTTTITTTTTSASSTSIIFNSSDPPTAIHTVGVGESQGSHKENATPAIIGAAVGGVILAVLAILIFLYLRRRKSTGNQALTPEQIFALSTHNNTHQMSMSGLAATHPPFGHSASLRDVTPFFISSTSAGFASISDLKRNRMEQDLPRGGGLTHSNIRTRSNPTSLDTLQQNASTSNLNTTQTRGIDGMDESVPPAYEELSTYIR